MSNLRYQRLLILHLVLFGDAGMMETRFPDHFGRVHVQMGNASS
jgi:hypothetical protein